MKPIPIEVGRIVVSKAGRDQGRRFVVLEEIDRDFVLVADGKLRTMERPKRNAESTSSPPWNLPRMRQGGSETEKRSRIMNCAHGRPRRRDKIVQV